MGLATGTRYAELVCVFPKGSHFELTTNFSSHEFDCRCTHLDCAYTFVSSRLAFALQDFRNELGPLTLNCGYRCPRHNSELSDASNVSQHMAGLAADVRRPEGMSVRDMYRYAKKIGFVGIGLYDWGIHVDMRQGPKAFWDFRGR